MKVCCVGAAGGVIERAVAVMVLIDECRKRLKEGGVVVSIEAA